MCDIEGVEGQDPLTWKFDCAMGKCKECPELLVNSGESTDLSSTLEFTQWRKGHTERATGPSEIFGLFTTSLPLAEAIALLKQQVVQLKYQIFVAYNQWRAKGRVQTYN